MGADRSIEIAEASPQLPLVDFLERLAFSFVVWNARETRRKKKRSRSCSRTERERLDADVATQYLSFAWIQKRSIVSFLSPAKHPQPVEPEGDEHPFPEVCERIAHWTGWPVRQVMAAAHGRFIDHRELVQVLNRLEEKGRAAQLYREFSRDYPDLAAKNGLVTVPSVPVPVGKKKRRGKSVPEGEQDLRVRVRKCFDEFKLDYKRRGCRRGSVADFAAWLKTNPLEGIPSDEARIRELLENFRQTPSPVGPK